MSNRSHELVSPTSLALLEPLITALGGADAATLKPRWSLPMPCFQMSAIRTLVCATPITAVPVFRAAMISAAAIDKVDVLVVRHGLWPETLDEVTIDVVAGRTRTVRMLWELGRYRGDNGSSWLVPAADGTGASVRLDASGLSIMQDPPYGGWDERGDGLARRRARRCWQCAGCGARDDPPAHRAPAQGRAADSRHAGAAHSVVAGFAPPLKAGAALGNGRLRREDEISGGLTLQRGQPHD